MVRITDVTIIATTSLVGSFVAAGAAIWAAILSRPKAVKEATKSAIRELNGEMAKVVPHMHKRRADDQRV